MRIEIVLKEDELEFNPPEEILKKSVEFALKDNKGRIDRIVIRPRIVNSENKVDRVIAGYHVDVETHSSTSSSETKADGLITSSNIETHSFTYIPIPYFYK